jgi:hypothetical protein
MIGTSKVNLGIRKLNTLQEPVEEFGYVIACD